MSKWAFKTIRHDNKGATIVEFAVVAPVFFLVFFGILGWTFTLMQLNVLQYATEQSARCAILPFDGSGNKQCVNTTTTFRKRAQVVPNAGGFTPTVNNPVPQFNVDNSSPPVPKSFNESCVRVVMDNMLSFGVPYVMSTLRSNYCRPAQH